MARLEAVANVALRVPGLALLDLLYRWDAAALGDLLRPRRGDPPLLRPPALRGAYCLGHLLCLVVLMLPVRSLVKLYLHLLTALLLGAGHTVAGDCVRRELEYGFQGAVYSDPAALGRFATALAGQLCLCVLCSLLMRSRQPWLFGAPLLPVLARLCGLPLHALPVLDTFAAILTALEVLYVLGSHVLVPFQLAAAACREVVQALEVYRLVALGVSLWSQLAIPLLFLIFWLVLFSLRLSSFLTSSSSPLAQQGLLFVLLSSADRVLQHAVLPHRPHLHRLLPRPGRPRPLQVLPAGLRRLPERQRHAQGGDGGCDAAAAGAADGAARPADPPVDLPPRHHPLHLHRGDLHAAVHDRDSGSHRAGVGGLPQQEPLEAFPRRQHVPLLAGFPLLHGLQDRPLLPPGFLAADPGLQLHAHLPAGGHEAASREGAGGSVGHAASAAKEHLCPCAASSRCAAPPAGPGTPPASPAPGR
ncbi:RING finger protein 145-like isoform X1 [Aquila chrysaetos chrysaetos]|uniref:RING finger protein 145-like isoform X1 n=1 Tax=Aquila chrysaetos chrysaetos TaxID=223781 RepID=UPI00117684B2|nr:RING finger protein 145-like isoform X1 [Aquila chrysaetos chrysaetos]